MRVGLTIEGSRVGWTVCLRWEGSRVVFDNFVGIWDGSRVGLRAVGPEDLATVGPDDRKAVTVRSWKSVTKYLQFKWWSNRGLVNN